MKVQQTFKNNKKLMNTMTNNKSNFYNNKLSKSFLNNSLLLNKNLNKKNKKNKIFLNTLDKSALIIHRWEITKILPIMSLIRTKKRKLILSIPKRSKKKS